MKYLALDAEMGGIGLDRSLLTLAFVLADEHYHILDSLYLKLKPNDGIYHIDAQGMEVNGIDLIEHDKVAITYRQGGTEAYNALKKWSDGDRLVPVGKGIAGDLSHIYDKLMSQNSWLTFVSCDQIDVGSLLKFYQLNHVIPHDLPLGLHALAAAWEISMPKFEATGKHFSDEDAEVTLKILSNLSSYTQKGL